MANLKELFNLNDYADIKAILEVAGELGKSENIEVYVVGGFVRDLILGKTLNDIDLMTVGDGISFAQTLANKLGVRKIIPFKKKITSKNIKKILSSFDIICDGTDNYNTRYLINDYCVKNKKILISSAISKFDGQLMKFNFKKKGPCYRCFMPSPPDLENNCQAEGIFSPVAGIMGSLQANEVLKCILNSKNDLTNHVLIFDSLKTEFRKSKISINPKCINKC